MGIKMFPKHYGDETLLAHLDGELSPLKERNVNAHLEACWECRAKLTELTSHAKAVARLLSEPLPSDIRRSAKGLERFLRAQVKVESQWSADTNSRITDSLGMTCGLDVAIAIGLVCAVGLSIWYLARRTVPDPPDV